jgi:multiple sugar transport system substrate-binding protein
MEIALEYAQFVASSQIQCTLYVENGGQPAHRQAWINEDANRIAGNFFRSTLRSMDEAYVRPRYNGALSFQESAGVPLVKYFREGGSADTLLDVMNKLYRLSLQKIAA